VISAGYAIHATDGEIGKVDSQDAETGERYLLVTTGHWIAHKTVLLPARLIDRIDHAHQAVYVKCSQGAVKAAPAYRDDRDIALISMCTTERSSDTRA